MGGESIEESRVVAGIACRVSGVAACNPVSARLARRIARDRPETAPVGAGATRVRADQTAPSPRDQVFRSAWMDR